MKFILDFLFGKKPDIFDKDGTVRHIHPEEKWKKWENRYQHGSEYNWKNHTGTKAPQDLSRKTTQ